MALFARGFPVLRPMGGLMRFGPKALTNKKYYATYATYGAVLFLLGLYVGDWKYVGKHIPVWRTYKGWLQEEEKAK